MYKNKIPLHSFIGANIIGISVFCLSLCFVILMEDLQYLSEENLLWIGLMVVISGTLLLSGVAFILKKKWARVLLNIVIILAFVGLGIVLYGFIMEMLSGFGRLRQMVEQISILIALAFVLLGLFLFANNADVAVFGESQEGQGSLENRSPKDR